MSSERQSRRPSEKFESPEYSVEIQTTFREARQIVYREGNRIVDFSAEAGGEKWNQLNALVPQGIEAGDLDRIVRNVANGLKQLGYEYVIFDRGERQSVPEEERAEARNRLREMGFEASGPAEDGAVKVWPAAGAQVKKTLTATDSIEMMKCVSAIRGFRCSPRILAKSKSARTEFM